MIKARFDRKQQEVTFRPMGDGVTYVQICLHETEHEVIDPESGEVQGIEYVYDFNEWHEPTESVDQEAIEADPEAYLDYVPAPAPVPPTPVPFDVRDQVETNTANIDYIAMMMDIDL